MSGGGGLSDSPTGSGAGLRPYLRRKKSSFGETKIAVLGGDGTGKSGLACQAEVHRVHPFYRGFCYVSTRVSTPKRGRSWRSLSVRFLTKRFIGEYDQTMENKYKYTTIVDTESVTFEVLDTISDNEDCGARDDVLRWGDGFMLVYSVVSRKSFDALHEVRRKIDEAKRGSSVPIIIVGNKNDLAHMRQVTRDEGEKLAADFGCSFVEVSASEDVTHVVEAFHTLCREVIDYKRRSRTFLDRVFGAFGREKASS